MRRFEVYADTQVTGLYFIESLRSRGPAVAAFVYHLGWAKPALLFSHVRLTSPIRAASPDLEHAYTTDTKVLIGQFTHTR